MFSNVRIEVNKFLLCPILYVLMIVIIGGISVSVAPLFKASLQQIIKQYTFALPSTVFDNLVKVKLCPQKLNWTNSLSDEESLAGEVDGRVIIGY